MVPITQDESISLFEFILDFPDRIFLFQSANNHLLNTLLASILIEFFGESLFCLRLPNVVSFLLFAYSIYKLLENRPLIQKWLGLVSLLFCLNLFEYFGLARGYGISIALLSFHIYSFSQYYKSLRLKWLLFAMISILMASTASFVLIPQSFLSFGLLLIFSIRQKSLNLISVSAFLVYLLILFWEINVAFSLNSAGEIYLGGRGEFFNDFVWVLLNYVRFKFGNSLFQTVFACYIGFILIALINHFRHHGFLKFTPFKIAATIFLGNVILSTLVAKLLDIPYPYQRAGLYLVPSSVLCFFLQPIRFDKNRIYFSTYLILALAVTSSFIFDFINKYKPVSTNIEEFSYLPNDLIETLSTQDLSAYPEMGIISVSDRFTDVFRYYNFKIFKNRFSVIKESENKKSRYFLSDHHVGQKEGLLYQQDDLFLQEDPRFYLSLDSLFLEEPFILDTSDDKYLSIFSDSLRTKDGNWLGVEIDLESDENARYSLAFQFKTDDNESYSKAYRLDRLLVQKNIKAINFFPLPSQKRGFVKLFVFNIDQERVSVQVTSVSLMQIR